MSAGLPGLGLGGLFFIFSALLAPFGELWRAIRGRSRPGAWRVVGRQFAQAVAMVVAIDLTLRLTYVGLALAGAGDVPSAASGTVLPLTLIGITTALLAVVVSGAKVAQLGFRIRSDALPRLPDALPSPAPLRALAFGGAASIAWIALLAVGASQLGPLATPPDASSSGGAGEEGTQSSLPDNRLAGEGPLVGLVTGLPAEEIRKIAAESPPQGEDPDAPEGAQSPNPKPPSVSPSASTGAHATAPSPAVSGKGAGNGGSTVQPAPPTSQPNLPSKAGPPEGSPAPEHAGPPEGSPAPEHAGPPQASPALESAGRGPQ